MIASRNTTDGIQAEMDDKRLLLHIGGAPALCGARPVCFHHICNADMSVFFWFPLSFPPPPPMQPSCRADISYARGYVSQWENFHDQIEPIATRLPYMTVGVRGRAAQRRQSFSVL